MLKSSVVQIIGELLNQNGSSNTTAKNQLCPNNIFIFPVTTNEVECITKSLKGKFSSGFEEIPEYLVKQCTKYIKKPLAHTYNASFQTGIIPDRLKIDKVKLFSKKGEVQTYKPLKIWIAHINRN